MKNKANFNNSEWTRKVDLKLYLRQNHLEGLFIHWDLPPELLIQDIWGGAQEFELRKNILRLRRCCQSGDCSLRITSVVCVMGVGGKQINGNVVI